MSLLLAAEAESDAPGLVDPVIGVMLWTLIVFGIVFIVLWKLVFPRIRNGDRRQIVTPMADPKQPDR